MSCPWDDPGRSPVDLLHAGAEGGDRLSDRQRLRSLRAQGRSEGCVWVSGGALAAAVAFRRHEYAAAPSASLSYVAAAKASAGVIL